MKVQIDQSGKVEKTNRPTVIGLSSRDGTVAGSILISANSKKEVQRKFRTAGRPRAFISRVFAVGIVCLLQEIRGWTEVVIDTEYPGHDEVIRRNILEVAGKVSLLINEGQISFAQIGKKSRAHSVAYFAFKNKKADIRLSAQRIVSLLL